MVTEKINVYVLADQNLTKTVLKKLPKSVKFVSLYCKRDGDTAYGMKKLDDNRWEDSIGASFLSPRVYTDEELCKLNNRLAKTELFADSYVWFTENRTAYEKAIEYLYEGKLNRINFIPISRLHGYMSNAPARRTTARKTTMRKTTACKTVKRVRR